jgi:GGDEF domain-containing protein
MSSMAWSSKEGSRYWLAIIDIDDFKAVNDKSDQLILLVNENALVC